MRSIYRPNSGAGETPTGGFPCIATSFLTLSTRGSDRSYPSYVTRAGGAPWVAAPHRRQRHPVDPPHRGALCGLPERYGKWNTVYTRFKRWRRDGTWTGIFSTLLDERDDQGQLDHDLWCIDGTIVHAAVAPAAPTAQPSPPAPGRRIDDATGRAGRPCVGLLAGRLHDQDSRACAIAGARCSASMPRPANVMKAGRSSRPCNGCICRVVGAVVVGHVGWPATRGTATLGSGVG